ncbi:MAG: hypothetical protein JNK64_36210 [Myxococcales bacterium]|nr:hypothetical protein [Myxococcales bacterium]
MRARVIVVALVVAACAREPALASYHEQALAVTAAYAPQVDALVARGERLGARLAAVPATVDGQPALAARLATDATTLAALRDAIVGLPAATAAAIAQRQRGPVVAVLTRTSSEVAVGVVQLGDELAAAEREMAALETRAKALAAAAAAAAAPATPGAPPAPAPLLRSATPQPHP